jgi:hypothetical protein
MAQQGLNGAAPPGYLGGWRFALEPRRRQACRTVVPGPIAGQREARNDVLGPDMKIQGTAVEGTDSKQPRGVTADETALRLPSQPCPQHLDVVCHRRSSARQRR